MNPMNVCQCADCCGVTAAQEQRRIRHLYDIIAALREENDKLHEENKQLVYELKEKMYA